MQISQRGTFISFMVDVLAAVALTAVGFLFHMIVHKGSPLAPVETIVLAVAVFAILKGYLWAFDRVSDYSPAHRGAALSSVQSGQRAGRSTKRNQSPPKDNSVSRLQKVPGPFTKSKGIA